MPDQLRIAAILQSQCGNLVIYDTDAIVKIVGALPRGIMCSMSSPQCDDPPPCPPPVELLDGFTLQQWSTYAKLKASIASRVCRENGVLKMRLASLRQTECEDSHASKVCRDNGHLKKRITDTSATIPDNASSITRKSSEDPLLHQDPWLKAALPGLHLQPIPIHNPWRRWNKNDDDFDSADCTSFSDNARSGDSFADLANHTTCIGQSNSGTEYDDQPSSYWQKLLATLQTDSFQAQFVDMVGMWEPLGPSAFSHGSSTPLEAEHTLPSEETDAGEVNGEDVFFQCFGVWPHDGADNIELYLKRALAFRRSPGAITSDTRSGQGYWRQLKRKLAVNSDTECENAISAALGFAESMA